MSEQSNVEMPETLSASGSQRTDQFSEAEHDDPIDLAYLRDLLGLLRDMEVAAFTAEGFAVSFKQSGQFDPEAHVPFAGRPQAQVIEDEDRSTSSSRVRGFTEARDGFRNPNLWPGQAGKVLQFDGSLA